MQLHAPDAVDAVIMRVRVDVQVDVQVDAVRVAVRAHHNEECLRAHQVFIKHSYSKLGY